MQRLKTTIETLEHDLQEVVQSNCRSSKLISENLHRKVLKEKDNNIHSLEKSLAKERGENSYLKSNLHEVHSCPCFDCS